MMPVRPTAPLALALTAVLAAASLTACGTGNDPNTVKIAFRKDTDNKVTFTDDYVRDVAREFEKKHKGKKVRLVPVQASQQDYYSKVQQLMRSPKTAPDVVHEDSFLIQPDIKSGYLKPLDKHLKKWKGWDRYASSSKDSVRGDDGKTYGVPDGTDTRGIWFNKKIFKKAGLPQNWHPDTWNDVLKAARTIKKKVPGVAPLNIFTGKAAGEAATMQGMEMLLYGIGSDPDKPANNPLYNEKTKKWVKGGEKFEDSLRFVRTVYSEKLGPDVDQALNPNMQTKIMTDLLPKNKVAMDIDGSWLGQQWLKTGGSPWPHWNKTLGLAPMPTQHGQAPGEVSMSGGWAWSVAKKSEKPDLAWQLIKTLQSHKNAVDWCIRGAQIATRSDVASDKRYLRSMPGTKFFTERVRHSHYRPKGPVYPQVSTAIAEAMESVTTGDTTVRQATKAYNAQLKSIANGAVTSQ